MVGPHYTILYSTETVLLLFSYFLQTAANKSTHSVSKNRVVSFRVRKIVIAYV